MRLMVTGGAGFIGTNFIRHVIDKKEIELLVNLDRLSYAGNASNCADLAENKRYFFEQVDIALERHIRRAVRKYGITHVVHLAAESHVDRSIIDPRDFIESNIVGTANLLEACRELWGYPREDDPLLGVRFLHVSTDEVFGSLTMDQTCWFDEKSPYNPSSPYAASKASSDHLVRAWQKTYKFPSAVTNCSNNYGPYQYPEKLIPVIIMNALDQKPIPIYGNGTNIRDWIHVEDHCSALWTVLTTGSVGETYCIGSDVGQSNLKIAHDICDIIDMLRPGLAGEGSSRDLITFVKDRPGHDLRYAIGSQKIRSELGWCPSYSFGYGLGQTVAWYGNNRTWVTDCLR